MATTFQQTDTASTCSVLAYCGPAGASTTSFGRKALLGGTAGTTGNFATCQVGESVPVMFEIDTGALFRQWTSGTWTVNLNITAGTSFLTWIETHVCRVSSACISLGGVASGSDSIVLSAGTKSMAFSQASLVTPNATDKITVQVVVSNTSGTPRSFFFMPSLTIVSPMSMDAMYVAKHQVYQPGCVSSDWFSSGTAAYDV